MNAPDPTSQGNTDGGPVKANVGCDPPGSLLPPDEPVRPEDPPAEAAAGGTAELDDVVEPGVVVELDDVVEPGVVVELDDVVEPGVVVELDDVVEPGVVVVVVGDDVVVVVGEVVLVVVVVGDDVVVVGEVVLVVLVVVVLVVVVVVVVVLVISKGVEKANSPAVVNALLKSTPTHNTQKSVASQLIVEPVPAIDTMAIGYVVEKSPVVPVLIWLPLTVVPSHPLGSVGRLPTVPPGSWHS